MEKTDDQVSTFILLMFNRYRYDEATRQVKLANYSAKNDLTLDQYSDIQDAILGRL